MPSEAGGVLLGIVVLGEPIPKARPRWGRGRTYTPARTKRAELVIAWEAAQVLRPPLDDARSRFRMAVEFHCGASWGPDTDNLVKLVMDALSPRRYKRRRSGPGLLWRNDRQVVRIEAERHDAASRPRTEIRIWMECPCPG